MKKIIQKAIAILLIALPFLGQAQVTTPANLGNPTDYVGWNNAQNFPLLIRYDRTDQPIDFYTGGLAAAFHRIFSPAESPPRDSAQVVL